MARLRGRWRHQQVKEILLHAVEVELPGDDARTRGGVPKGCELIRRPGYGEAVVQPVGVRQSHRCGE